MTEVDIAIVGSDQASALLAGVLARNHRLRVLLVQHLAAPSRLPRNFYMSFATATRPETFAFVARQTSEAQRLLNGIAGRQVLLNVSPLCVAFRQADTEALAHMFHMSPYFGLEMERVEGDAKNAHSAYRVRGVQWVRPRLLWPALSKWVTDAGVTVVDASDGKIATHRNGSAHIEAGEQQFDATQLALTDGSALLKYGHKGDIRQNFIRQWGSALLTEPAEMRDSVVLQPGTGFCAWRQANGTLGIVASVAAGHIGNLARKNLNAKAPLRRAGQAEFMHLVPADGAPVVGKMSRSEVVVVNGFGQNTLHLVPAIARYLRNQASDVENAYFEPRGPHPDRKNVADFALNQVAGDFAA